MILLLPKVVNLDARKVASSSGKIPGKRCGGSYISASFKCQSHRGPDGKLTEEGKASARELAAKVRGQRNLKPKTLATRQDIEKQITNLEADLKKENIPAPVKVAVRKELTRLRSQLRELDRKPDLKVIDGGKKNERRNLTEEFDNKIADVRKIKDPQDRYNAAQRLQKELGEYTTPYARDALKGTRRKVSNLISSTRQSAARREGTQPTRSNAPFALPRNPAPTRVRGPSGRYYSIDAIAEEKRKGRSPPK